MMTAVQSLALHRSEKDLHAVHSLSPFLLCGLSVIHWVVLAGVFGPLGVTKGI